ncbi:MAG: hypothetical protein ACPGWR_08535 [Ardenticatenaceae bacterium]
MIVEVAVLLVAGGALWSGASVYTEQVKGMSWWLGKGENNQEVSTDPVEEVSFELLRSGVVEELGDSLALKEANQTLALSSVSLGLATAGALFQPALSLVSAPIVFYIFYPSFQASYKAWREERKVTPALFEATRVSVCLIMGYYFVGALDAWLRSVTERVLVDGQEELNRSLEQQFSNPRDRVKMYSDGAEVDIPLKEVSAKAVMVLEAGDLILVDGTVLHGEAWIDEMLVTGDPQLVSKASGDRVFASTVVVSGQIYVEMRGVKEQVNPFEIRDSLQEAVANGTRMQQFGETGGQKTKLGMFAAFAVALPIWRNASRATGFLTTSFGSQMNSLGPYTLQNFINLASQQGILIKDARALESANLVNTIVIDARLLSKPAVRAQIKGVLNDLRQRRWPMQSLFGQSLALYLLSDGDELGSKQLAAEFGFDEYVVEASLTGRVAVIEGLQSKGRFVCYVGDGVKDALIMKQALISVSTRGAATITSDAAQVILVDQHLNQLGALFDLATEFSSKQRFNLAWPLLMDLVDIGTTLFMRFGLSYSLLFTYSGVLISAANAKRALTRYKKEPNSEQVELILPNVQLSA